MFILLCKAYCFANTRFNLGRHQLDQIHLFGCIEHSKIKLAIKAAQIVMNDKQRFDSNFSLIRNELFFYLRHFVSFLASNKEKSNGKQKSIFCIGKI